MLLPANESDTKQLRPLVEETLKLYPWLSPRYPLADKGYDSVENFAFLDSVGIIPVIAVRKPKKRKGEKRATYYVIHQSVYGGEYESSYTKEGFPLCTGNAPMEYVGSHSERGHLFKCPEGGCALKDKTLFPMYCQDESWEKPKGALLRIIGKVPRFSKRWKELYKLRQSIKRFFGSAKRSRLLNKCQYLVMDKVRAHTRLSLLSYAATMLARCMAGDFKRMRHMRV